MQQWEYCQLRVVPGNIESYEYPVHWGAYLFTSSGNEEMFKSEATKMGTDREGESYSMDPERYLQLRDSMISRLGSEGWEMTAATGRVTTYFFKRPKP